MSEKIIQRDAGLIRKVLRFLLRTASIFFPKEPTIRQSTYLGIPLIVWANEHIGRRIILSGTFEKGEINKIRELVSEGDVCIDVGSNIGTHAIVLGKVVGQSGKVYAFEPNRGNALLVELNAHLNNLHNIFVQRLPVSASLGQRLVRAAGMRDSSLDHYMAASNPADIEQEGDLSHRSTTLDHFCDSLGMEPNFIKVDVEGGELQVLLGARHILSRSKKCIVMVEVVEEYLNRFENSVQQLCAYMHEINYKPYAIRKNKLVTVLANEIKSENIFFLKLA